MTTRQNNTSKNNPFLLSNQVKSILISKGYSSVFNFQDYEYFKSECKHAFNVAVAISERFIQEAEQTQNDLSEYIY